MTNHKLIAHSAIGELQGAIDKLGIIKIRDIHPDDIRYRYLDALRDVKKVLTDLTNAIECIRKDEGH